MQYGYYLHPDISDQRMVGMLREIEEDLHRKIRTKPGDETNALYARIKYLRVFLQVLFSFRKDDNGPCMPEIQRLLLTCTEMLYVVQDTVYLGKTSDDR